MPLEKRIWKDWGHLLARISSLYKRIRGMGTHFQSSSQNTWQFVCSVMSLNKISELTLLWIIHLVILVEWFVWNETILWYIYGPFSSKKILKYMKGHQGQDQGNNRGNSLICSLHVFPCLCISNIFWKIETFLMAYQLKQMLHNKVTFNKNLQLLGRAEKSS